jgi:SAM-dependent methyltransferase
MGKVDFKPLQEEHWGRGDATGWFEAAYAKAEGDRTAIPWADKGINPNLIEWATAVSLTGAGQTALVIGCGLGDDAEYLASLGFAVTAFDISPTAVAWCRERFPDSTVRYVVGDLFAKEFAGVDLVLEAHTLQALPRSLRAAAVEAIAGFAAGRLLVVCRGCDVPEPNEEIPWPLTREELAGFKTAGLSMVRFEDFYDQKDPPQRRYRVEYQRSTA